ncbi:MAG TPA: NAD(P)H-binding protein [Candidatus Krumholzibacteria bacterium]|nr:NAD(P)H-binding protein [Candidatus Krumholzibacteria bacterium]
MMQVVVNTPTGNIGRLVTEKLLQAGCEPTLLARHPEKVRDFAARGATVLEGHLEDEAFVARATRGAELLFWLTPPHPTAPSVRAFQNHLGRIAAAAVREHRIPRVVHLSSYGAHLESKTGPILGLRETEKMLDDAAHNVLHLRPGMFMENHLGSIESMQQVRKIFLPAAGGTRFPAVATRDVAAVAAERILNTSWTGHQVLEIFGPAPVSFDEAARTISDALGQPITHVQVSREQATQVLTGKGMSGDFVNGFLELLESLESGHLAPDPRAPKRTMPTSFADFARDVIAPLVRSGAPH